VDHVIVKAMAATMFSATGDLGAGGMGLIAIYPKLTPEARTKNLTRQQNATMEIYAAEYARQPDGKKDPNQAFAIARQKAAVVPGPKGTKQENEAMNSAISEAYPDAPEAIRPFLASQARRFMPLQGFGSTPEKDAAAAAVAAKAAAPSYGDFWFASTQEPGVWPAAPSAFHGGAGSKVPVMPKEFGAAVLSAARERLSADLGKAPSDVDPTSVMYTRIGPTAWHGTYSDDEGKVTSFVIQAPEVQSKIDKNYRELMDRNKKPTPAN
jgi:hypothetical protein